MERKALAAKETTKRSMMKLVFELNHEGSQGFQKVEVKKEGTSSMEDSQRKGTDPEDGVI